MNSTQIIRRISGAVGVIAALLTIGAAPSPPAPLGTIKAPVPSFTLRLLGDRGLVEVQGKQGVARVASGRYWLVGWKSELTDVRGRLWTTSAGTFGSMTTAQFVTVTPEQPVTVRVGSPLKAELTADAVGNRVNFRIQFFGSVGERCSEVKVDGALPPKPWLTIRDPSGAVVARTEFDYGCSFFCHYVWRAPQTLKGSYTATVDFDFGPMKVNPVAPVPFELAGVDPDAIAARPGAEAPDFTLKAVEDGQPFQLQRTGHNATLVSFFCGCPACAAVAQQLAQVPSPRPDLVALFNDPELCTPAAAKAFREKTGFRGAILADPDGRTAAAYDSAACPRCWAVDETGMIRYVNPTPGTPPKEIVETALKQLTR